MSWLFSRSYLSWLRRIQFSQCWYNLSAHNSSVSVITKETTMVTLCHVFTWLFLPLPVNPSTRSPRALFVGAGPVGGAGFLFITEIDQMAKQKPTNTTQNGIQSMIRFDNQVLILLSFNLWEFYYTIILFTAKSWIPEERMRQYDMTIQNPRGRVSAWRKERDLSDSRTKSNKQL